MTFSVLAGKEVHGRSDTILEGESGFNDPVGIALMIGMVGQPQTLPAGSYAVLAVTFVAGIVATIAQIRFADNAQ